MTELITTSKQTAILGLGVTGLSVARYLTAKGCSFVVIDSRKQPPGLEELALVAPHARVYAGPFTDTVNELLLGADEIVISPGLSRDLPFIQKALQAGIPVVGDITLFLREAKAPVIGITGSNGKTTVTSIVGGAAKRAGLKAPVGGNIGVPALDLLADDVDLYVLELSSFQLESIPNAGLSVGCVLNVSEDHMDRYVSLTQYCMAKQRIYWGAKNVVYNLNDRLTQPPVVSGVARYGFGLEGKVEKEEQQYLWNKSTDTLNVDQQELIRATDLKIAGQHNIANALAAFSLCDAAGIPRAAVIDELRSFEGLAHRCQWVAEVSGVTFINDSKATNVGAAVAAIQGLSDRFTQMTLIVGGDGKGADFAEFARVLNHYVKNIVFIGRDAPLIAKHIDKTVNTIFSDGMSQAVNLAREVSPKGSVVLLSPACASFDMFTGYEDRGKQFIAAVEVLTR